MFQYIFFVCSAIINITEEQSEELYLGIPLNVAIKLNLQRKHRSQVYNSQYFSGNYCGSKTIHPINHPYENFDSSFPLDLSKNHFVESSEPKNSNLNETKDFISESSSSEIDFKNFDIYITQNDGEFKLKHIANEIIKEQADFLKNKENVELYENRIEKNKRLKKEFEKYNYNQLYIELKSYLNIELMYDKEFIFKFVKRYANAKPAYGVIKINPSKISNFKGSLENIIKIISKLKSELSKISTKESMKKVLHDHIICFENLVKYYQKLLSSYKRYKYNYTKLLYWYMRYSVEVHMLKDLFDLNKIRMGYYTMIRPAILNEKSFDKLFTDLESYDTKTKKLLKSVIKTDKFIGEYITRFIMEF